MAKMVYAATAAALAALVAGFFVDTSSVPLFISIGLSAVVMFLILFGWSRKVRSGMDELLGDVQRPEVVEELVIAEVSPEELKPKRSKPQITGVKKPDDLTAVIRRPKVAARKKPTTPSSKKRTPPKPPTPAKPPSRKRSPKPVPRQPVPRRSAPVRTPPKSKAKPKPKPKATAKNAKASTRRVVVIPGRSRYHRRGCRFAKSDEAREVKESTARDRGYEPCTVCDP